MLGAAQILSRANVAVALEQVILVGNVQRG